VNIGDFRLWRSSVICWCAFALFTFLTILWQVVDIKAYPHMERDWLILTVGSGTIAFLFFVLAIRATKQKKV